MKSSIQTQDGIIITAIPEDLMADPNKTALKQYVAQVRAELQASGQQPPLEGIPFSGDRSLMGKVEDFTTKVSEVGTDILGNAAAFPVSGVAGLVAGANTLIGRGEQGDAARAVESVQSGAREMFSPKTGVGQQAMQAFTETVAPVVQPVAEGFEQLSQASGDLALREAQEAGTLPPKGQAAVAALGYTLPTALLELATLGVFGRLRSGTRLIDDAGRATPQFENELAKFDLDFDNLDPTVKNSIPEVMDDSLRLGGSEKRAAQDAIKGELERGSTKGGLVPFEIDRGKVTQDRFGQAAIDQGYDPSYLQSAKTANRATKDEMIRMAKMQKGIMQDRTKATTSRPSDIVGQAVKKDIDYLDSIVKDKGEALDEFTKSSTFKNSNVSIAPIATELKNILDDFKVGYDPSDISKPMNFEVSDIQLDTSAQSAIKDVLKVLNTTNLTPERMHQLKRTLDKGINYKSKKMREMTPDAEKVIKRMRRALNTELRKTNPKYAELNTDLSEALDATGDFDKAMKSVKIDGEQAASGIGQQLRKILSKTQDRTEIVSALKKLQNTRAALGGKNNIDASRLVLFNDMLDTRHGDVATRGFAQETAKGVSEALKSSNIEQAMSKRGVFDFVAEKATGKTPEARKAAAKRKSDQEAFKALRDLLEQDTK